MHTRCAHEVVCHANRPPAFLPGVRVARFKSVHGPVMGTLLSLPGTGLPTSTFAYYLADDLGLFQLPTHTAYLHAWDYLQTYQWTDAAAILCAYIVVCAVRFGRNQPSR